MTVPTWKNRLVTFAYASALLGIGAIAGYSFSQQGALFRQGSISLSKAKIESARNAIFEVIIRRVKDKDIKYEKELPNGHGGSDTEFWSVGTAFQVGENRFLSAAHVFGLSSPLLNSEFSIRSHDGRVYRIGRVLRFDERRDIIEFEVVSPPKDSASLKLETRSEIGDQVYSVGNALGEGISFRNGQIASYTSEPIGGEWKYIRFSAPASPGNSGGPLLNVEGQVIGIIVLKNEAENLNFAVPVSESEKITKDAAWFHGTANKLARGKKELTKDWTASFPLPLPILELAALAQGELDRHFSVMVNELYTEDNADFPPAHPAFAVFTRSQMVNGTLNFLQESEGPEKYQFSYFAPKQYSLGSDSFMNFTEVNKELAYLDIRSPGEKSTRFLIENPDYVMDQALKTGFLRRDFGTENIRITSVGKPKATQPWVDDVGRRWWHSAWDIAEHELRVTSNCTPTPSGVVCQLAQYSFKQIVPTEKVFNYELNSLILGHTASLEQWEKYLKLESEWIAPALRDLKIRLEGKKVVFESKKIRLNFTDADLNSASELTVYTGYDPDQKFGDEVQTVHISPSLRTPTFAAQVHLIYEPAIGSQKWAKERWEAVGESQAPFDGSISFEEGTNTLRLPLMRKVGRYLASKPEASVARNALVTCYVQSGANMKIFKERCRRFQNSVMQLN